MLLIAYHLIGIQVYCYFILYSICASRKGLTRLPLNMSAEDVNHNDNGQAGGFNFSSTFKPWVDTSSIPPPKYNSTPLSPQASPTKGVPADKKKLKKVTRKGKWSYDNPSRAELWHRICLRKASSGQGIYDEVSKDMNLTNSETGADQSLILPEFVDKDYFYTYYLNAEGKQKLSQVLCVLHHTRPDIVYCPLLAPVASLLLHYMDCSDVYECLAALHSSNTYKHMEQTKVGHEAFRITFGRLVERFASSVHKTLVQKTNGNPQVVYDDWIRWILKDLSIHHLLRVMDCYLVEGLKIFYRMGLAILSLYKKSKSYEGAADIPSSIQEFLQTTHLSPEDFLSVGFQFRGLSRSVIGAYQTKVKSSVDTTDGVGSRSSPQTIAVPLALRKSGSTIVTPKQLQALWHWIPTRFSIYQPKLVFTSEEHGFSINTFYQRCEYCEPTILLIKTMENEIFGAYLSTCWSQRNDEEQKSPYFGTGESFLFSFAPEEKKYPWVGMLDDGGGVNGPESHSAHLFMRAESNLIAVGGGEGDGILLEGGLTEGRSKKCATFNNAPLAKDGVFHCKVVEVITFEDSNEEY